MAGVNNQFSFELLVILKWQFSCANIITVCDDHRNVFITNFPHMYTRVLFVYMYIVIEDDYYSYLFIPVLALLGPPPLESAIVTLHDRVTMMECTQQSIVQ